MKSLDMIDSLVLEMLDRVRFKDISTNQINHMFGLNSQAATIIKQLKEAEDLTNLDKDLVDPDVLSKA
jgi:hypothetical protein